MPDDRVSPIVIADFLGLHDPGVQHTFRRLLKPIFKDIEILRAADLDAMKSDGEYLLAPNDDGLRRLAFEDAVERVCSAYNAHRCKQLVCIIGGRSTEEKAASEVLTAQGLSQKYCYTIPSLARIFQNRGRNRGPHFDHFIRALVDSARDRSTYLDALDPEIDESSLGQIRACVANLSQGELSENIFRFVDWIREALCRRLHTEAQIRRHFKAKKEEEARQRGRKRRGER